VLVAAGGVLVGLIVGWLVAQIHRRLDDFQVETVITLLTPYAAYIPAEQFHDAVLEPILTITGRSGYPYILLIDGNDPRGIDVAILSRYPIIDVKTHIFDLPGFTQILTIS